MSSLTDQIRALLDQLDASGTATATGKMPEPDTGQGLKPYLSDDETKFVRDYWVIGHAGAMAGVLLEHYSQGQMLVSMMASGHIPLHLCVFVPEPSGTVWTLGLRSAGDPDVNWIDGSKYRPVNPPGQNVAAWIAAGCPHENAYGKYNVRGEIDDPALGTFSPGPPLGGR